MKTLSRALLPAIAITLPLMAVGCSSRNDDVSARNDQRYHGGYGGRNTFHTVSRNQWAGAQVDLRSPYSGERYADACRR